MRISNIVIKPVITEKSLQMANQGRYTFEVNKKATKGSIAKEINRIYDVNVEKVRTMILPGKKRKVFGTRKFTKGSVTKKAVVDLEEGQSIDVFTKE